MTKLSLIFLLYYYEKWKIMDR